MKYMLMIQQGTTPTPLDPEAWAALSPEEQQPVNAAYKALHSTRGELLRRLGRTCEAVDAYRRALGLVSDDADGDSSSGGSPNSVAGTALPQNDARTARVPPARGLPVPRGIREHQVSQAMPSLSRSRAERYPGWPCLRGAAPAALAAVQFA